MGEGERVHSEYLLYFQFMVQGRIRAEQCPGCKRAQNNSPCSLSRISATGQCVLSGSEVSVVKELTTVRDQTLMNTCLFMGVTGANPDINSHAARLYNGYISDKLLPSALTYLQYLVPHKLPCK